MLCSRFDFDMTTFRQVKVTADYEFPLAINMKPFVVGGALATMVPNDGESEDDFHTRVVSPAAPPTAVLTTYLNA